MDSNQQCRGNQLSIQKQGGKKEIGSLLYTRHKNQFQVDWRPKWERQRHLTWPALGPAKKSLGTSLPFRRKRVVLGCSHRVLGHCEDRSGSQSSCHPDPMPSPPGSPSRLLFLRRQETRLCSAGPTKWSCQGNENHNLHTHVKSSHLLIPCSESGALPECSIYSSQ